MIKRRQIAATAFGILFAVLLIAYIAVVRPLTKTSEDEVVPPDLIEGESLDTTGQYRLLFPRIPRENIASIEVSGPEGEYYVERMTLDGEETFVINGYKGITYYDEAFSSMVVSAGYTITRDRLTENGTAEEFERYGLDEPQLTWTITDTSGNAYTVYVGDRLISGEGYYGYLEGRDAIYVLSTNVESGLMMPVETYINPVICAGMSSDDYTKADNFIVTHGDEVFIGVQQMEKEEFTNPDANVETKLIYPGSYKTNDSFFFNIIASFISLTGDEAVYLGEDLDEFKNYGIDMECPAYSVYFTYGNIEYYIVISELSEDGYYYATSNLTDYLVISKVPADTFSWLKAELSDWVYDYPIMYNITYVDSLDVETSSESVSFGLIHGIGDDEKATLEIEADNGFTLSNSDVYNFREFYKVLLSVQLMGDTELDETAREELMSNEDALMATVRFNMQDGTVNEFKFYRYSTRRALLTSNGDGRFYVMTDWIEKIISDLSRLQKGLEVDSYTKN